MDARRRQRAVRSRDEWHRPSPSRRRQERKTKGGERERQGKGGRNRDESEGEGRPGSGAVVASTATPVIQPITPLMRKLFVE